MKNILGVGLFVVLVTYATSNVFAFDSWYSQVPQTKTHTFGTEYFGKDSIVRLECSFFETGNNIESIMECQRLQRFLAESGYDLNDAYQENNRSFVKIEVGYKTPFPDGDEYRTARIIMISSPGKTRNHIEPDREMDNIKKALINDYFP
ncbi:hypothetical protein C0584_00225 [Candidatus Parcubacteria bacterium]|nr:MAG: hypothetical protein C0584_00225 [Candidatus Parcubacteria bacterium]